MMKTMTYNFINAQMEDKYGTAMDQHWDKILQILAEIKKGADELFEIDLL